MQEYVLVFIYARKIISKDERSKFIMLLTKKIHFYFNRSSRTGDAGTASM